MKGHHSTISELARLVGRREFARLEAICPDRRELFQVAARTQQLSEADLCMKLADKLRLPALTRLTDDFKYVDVPGVAVEECLAKAFVFFQAANGLYGVACVEPAWLTPFTSRFEQFPTLLTTWAIVRNWIHHDRGTPKETPHPKVVTGDFRKENPAELTIDAIVDRVASLGVSAAALDFLPDRIRYEVIAPDLNTYSGEIKTNQSNQVEELLAMSLIKQPHVVQREIEGVTVSITVSPNVKRRRFYINWTPQLPKTVALNARLLIG